MTMAKKIIKQDVLVQEKIWRFSLEKRHLITGNRKHKKIDHTIDLSVSDDNIIEVS
jgi:hypothetical protein